MEQFELDLGVGKVKPPAKHPSPMVRKYGLSANDETCKTCKHLYRKEYQAGAYYKCELLGNTNGAGTDIRLKWDACGKYEERVRKKE